MKGKKQKEPAGMNAGEIFAALDLLEKERGIGFPVRFSLVHRQIARPGPVLLWADIGCRSHMFPG